MNLNLDWRCNSDYHKLPPLLKIAHLGYRLREIDTIIADSTRSLESYHDSSRLKETAIALLDEVIDQRKRYESELDLLIDQQS